MFSVFPSNYSGVHKNGKISTLPAVYKRLKVSKRSQSASIEGNQSELLIYQTQLESLPFKVKFRNYLNLPNVFVSFLLQPKPCLQPCNPGTSGSGKSTLIKQMKIIHGNGYSKHELVSYKGLVYSNIFTAMQSLLTGMSTLELSFKGEECKVGSPVRVQVIRFLNMALTSHPSFNYNFQL